MKSNLRTTNEKETDGLKKEFNVKLSELKEEYVATSSAIRMESQSLSQSLQESKTLQVSIEKRVNDIDSGNQQLLEKILAVEQDLDGKVQGINNASGGISDKISLLENDNKSHAQNIVTIQESLAIQNDTMKKVESERQNAAAKAKEDIDATSAANTKAINEMRDHFSTALSSLEITLKKEQTDGNSNLSDKLQQVENDLGSRMTILEKSGPESMKNFGNQLEEKLQEMNKDLELKLKETDGKTNKNANDIASQSNMLQEHNESINSNITSISSISNKIAAFDKEFEGLTKQVGSNTTEIGLLKENQGSQVAIVADLEGKVKLNQDHIKNIDDTLDGLKNSIDVFEGRHIETVEKMKEVTVLAGSIQNQVKEQEEKIVEQSNSNMNLIKDQIKDLENQQGVSAQKITELDSGMQSMLEKVLGVEKNLVDGLSRLDTADKSILENLSSLNAETTQTVSQMKKDVDVKFTSQLAELEKVQERISSNTTQLTHLEPRVKKNEDQIRHIDDTLDGLKKSINDLNTKHIEAADRTAELNVLINNTQIQLKDQEKKLVDQSNSDLNLIKGQINDLENLAGASNQRIAELDNGTQAMLEKLVGLENGMTDKINNLNIIDAGLQDEIKNLRTTNEKETDGLKKEFNVKLSKLKEEYVATSSAIRMESQSLSQSLQESKTLQVSIEKRVNDIDSGNQQLLEKILAVEQDLDGKVQGINNASGGISDKISLLENVNKSHAQNIVTIQESLAIQNDTMKKVESERQNAAAKAKEDIDATSAANTKAINEMRDHFSTALSSLEITLKKDQTDGNSNLSDKLQQVENDLGSRMTILEKSGPESMKNFGNQLEEKLQEMNKDLELKLKETDGKTNKNANDIASQSK